MTQPSMGLCDTAAASLPPAIMPIGAEMIGCSMSNRSASRVRNRIDGSVSNSLRRHPEVLAALHGEPRRMGHKRPRPSFETPRKSAAPQDDGLIKLHRWHFGHQNVERPFWVKRRTVPPQPGLSHFLPSRS